MEADEACRLPLSMFSQGICKASPTMLVTFINVKRQLVLNTNQLHRIHWKYYLKMRFSEPVVLWF